MNHASSGAAAARGTSRARSLILCALFAALTAVGGFIRIPLPVIPFTLQLFFVAFSGLLLGPSRGAAAQFVYLVVGLCGFPIFAKGGGIGYVLEPSFGYLIGFVAQAGVTGWCIRRFGEGKDSTVPHILLSCVAGLAVDYVFGMTHMYLILNFYLGKATTVLATLWTGGALFLPKDLALCVLTAIICRRLIPALRRAGLSD